MSLGEWICCPHCRGEVKPETGAREGTGQAAQRCEECDREYPTVDGVIDFAPGLGGERKLGQRLMESERIVAIYETRWWRASRLTERAFGIGLEEEMSLVERITHPGPADVVLDLACGPGLYARRFAERGPEREVLGLDLSWPMLRYGVRKAQRLGIRNLSFLHGDAHRLPFRDASLDAASCCGALHLFPEVRRALGELGRAIKPGGRFAAAVFGQRPWDPLPRLREAYDAWIGLHRFQPGELEALLDEAGFKPTVHHARGVWMIVGGVRRPASA